MNKFSIYEKLTSILSKDDIKIDEPMKDHISFKVGGPADILVRPRTENEIKEIFKIIKSENIPYFIKGNGTNLLVKDGGIRGIVIEISDNFNLYKIEDNTVEVQSGLSLSVLCRELVKKSLKGLEFASGIPGTVGGALCMNAGAYGGEMKDVVKFVRVMNMKGEITELNNEEMEFGYRGSVVTRKGLISLSCKFELKKGNHEEIKELVDDLTNRRKTKQPLEFPSAGSTFKRPQGYYAGQLIDESGLRGFSFRGAKISQKHCGFVINPGGASAKDVLDLINMVKNRVYEKFGVMLEEEVKILGDD